MSVMRTGMTGEAGGIRTRTSWGDIALPIGRPGALPSDSAPNRSVDFVDHLDLAVTDIPDVEAAI